MKRNLVAVSVLLVFIAGVANLWSSRVSVAVRPSATADPESDSLRHKGGRQEVSTSTATPKADSGCGACAQAHPPPGAKLKVTLNDSRGAFTRNSHPLSYCIDAQPEEPVGCQTASNAVDTNFFTLVLSNTSSRPLDLTGSKPGGRVLLFRHIRQGGMTIEEPMGKIQEFDEDWELRGRRRRIPPGAIITLRDYNWPGGKKAPAGDYVARLESDPNVQVRFQVVKVQKSPTP